MARSTKSYEERLLQLEKREQESLEKAKQYAAQKRELKKRQKDVETAPAWCSTDSGSSGSPLHRNKKMDFPPRGAARSFSTLIGAIMR